MLSETIFTKKGSSNTGRRKVKRFIWFIPLLLSALDLGGCAKVAIKTNGLYELPIGGWSKNIVVDSVKQFAPSLGGEFGISFGENITSFEVVTKYCPLNTSDWVRYNHAKGDSVTSYAQIWVLMVGLGIDFPVEKFTPLLSVRAGYIAPSGSETIVTQNNTYSWPLTFLRKAPAVNVSLGLALPKLKFVRFTPKIEYTLAPAIQFPGGPRPGWLSLLETGIGIDFLIAQPQPKVEVEKELALRIQEKEQKMSESYFSQGVSYYNLTKYLEALHSLDLALIWNPDNSNAEEWVGRAKRAKEDSEIKNYLEQADRSYQAGQYVEAMLAAEKVLAIDGENPKALEMKHRAELAFNGQLEREQSENVKQHLDAGKTFYLKGDYNGAIEEWNKVLASVPNHEEAKQYLSWAEGKRQENIDRSLTLVDGYMKEEQWELAIKECDKVLFLDSKNLQASELKRIAQRRLAEKEENLVKRAATAFQTGDIINAEENSRAALRINPKNSEAQNYLNKVKGKKQKIKKEEVSDLYLKGIDAYTKGDFESAIFSWTKVLEYDPNYFNAKRNLERARAKLALSQGG
jgi:tetratricopeptide (TPR) repeat protein